MPDPRALKLLARRRTCFKTSSVAPHRQDGERALLAGAVRPEDRLADAETDERRADRGQDGDPPCPDVRFARIDELDGTVLAGRLVGVGDVAPIVTTSAPTVADRAV